MIVAARVYAVNSIARLRAACFWGVFRVGVLCFAHHLDRAEVFECDNNIEKGRVINTDANENIEMKWAALRDFLHTEKRVNPFNHTEH